ncbi:hypothetical protein P3T76_007440 [Phytophthora citrophthora]|uniref:Uncharacterized protein n=1 Tax=Phytophthora citrophthora TaxID=4793 RepID=A0AAD9LNY1_9STRA|nr:hypothetical protein P3T76_007440 [Phytophthora citrophthora]
MIERESMDDGKLLGAHDRLLAKGGDKGPWTPSDAVQENDNLKAENKKIKDDCTAAGASAQQAAVEGQPTPHECCKP